MRVSAELPKPPELSEEEIAERIKRTEENESAQLLLKLNGKSEIWNALVCRQMKAESWNKFLNELSDDYINKEDLKTIKPITDEQLERFGIKEDQSLKIKCKGLYFEKELCLKNFIFPDVFDLTKSFFKTKVWLSGAIFCNYTYFSGCTFLSFLSVADGNFKETCRFSYAAFMQGLNCENTKFENDINFYNTTINAFAFFQKTQFCGSCAFDEITFSGGAFFEESHFFKGATFRYSKFESSISASKAVFEKTPDFSNCIFEIAANFSECNIKENIVFRSSSFRGVANFDNVKFKAPPIFNCADIQEIYFDETRKNFQNNINILDIKRSKTAWQTLIILMDKMHNLPQRQIFHEKLLEVEELEEENKWVKKLYRLYNKLGFGYSLVKPLITQCYSTAFFTWLYVWFLWDFKLSMKFSLSNTTPFLNISRLATSNIFEKVNGQWYDLLIFSIAGLQSIISLFLLFLIGLALRNRFRIK